MPLLPITNDPQPNALYVPEIKIRSVPIAGSGLNTSVAIVLAKAHVDEDGQWNPTGRAADMFISEATALEPDIAHLQPRMDALFAEIVSLIGEMNAIRGVL